MAQATIPNPFLAVWRIQMIMHHQAEMERHVITRSGAYSEEHLTMTGAKFDTKICDTNHLLNEQESVWTDKVNVYYSAPDVNGNSTLMSSYSCHMRVSFLPHVHVV
jgi:hypothetical protein